MEKSEKENKKTSEPTSDLDLLTDFIIYQSEHSRWSTAITLLISITVASLIALLGYALQYQNLNFFNTKTPPDVALVQVDSIRIIVPEQRPILNPDTIISELSSKAIIQSTYKAHEQDTMSLILTNNNGSDMFIIGASKEKQTTQALNKQNDLKLKKDSTIVYDIQSVKLKCSIENTSESKLSIFHILFTSITFLSLIFTLFIYILRRNIYKQIVPLKDRIEKRNMDNMLTSLSLEISTLITNQKLGKGNEETEDRLDKVRNFKKDLDELLKNDSHEKTK